MTVRQLHRLLGRLCRALPDVPGGLVSLDAHNCSLGALPGTWSSDQSLAAWPLAYMDLSVNKLQVARSACGLFARTPGDE
jgi:hypothetical protein